MDLNVNELPNRKPQPDNAAFDSAPFNEAALASPRATTATWLKTGSFLAIIFILTALAITSHHQAPGEAAIPDAPPAATAGTATMPTVTAPTERATTGGSPAQIPAPPK